jgi:putative addiction module component (TIGR02574 family)
LPLVGPGGTLVDMTKAALRDELRKLSLAERLELVEELWDSIAAECERQPFPLSDEQRADLERRLADADADPSGGTPWDQVRERIRRRPR